MAEKFDMPKPFTKPWWKYVWDYYKVHIFVVLFIIGGISYFVYEKVNQSGADINFAMAGNIVIQPENEDKFQAVLNDMVEDINKDGKKKVFRPMFYIYAGSTQTGTDYYAAMSQKLSIEFTSQKTFLFVLDKTMADGYVELPDSAFLKTYEWAGDIPKERLHTDSYGRNFGVNLKDSKILKECGIDGSDMYLFIRICTDTSDEARARYDESLRIAGELIK